MAPQAKDDGEAATALRSGDEDGGGARVATETSDAITFNVPANTQFGLVVLCNSAYYQKVTVTPSGQSAITLQKTNSGAAVNQIISSGGQYFSTGSTGQVTVDIQYSPDQKTWTESQLSSASLGFGAPNTQMWVVGSEDSSDNDFNDTIVMFNTPIR